MYIVIAIASLRHVVEDALGAVLLLEFCFLN